MSSALTRCPSAQPGMEEASVLGVILPSESGNKVAYIKEAIPAGAVLGLAAPAAPTEVFRFSARCEERKCLHFDGVACNLASRIVSRLPAVVDRLPACTIRRSCRWFDQEGSAACFRCPQVITAVTGEDTMLASIAMPNDGSTGAAQASTEVAGRGAGRF